MKIHYYFPVFLSLAIYMVSPSSCIAQDSSKISTDYKKALVVVVKELDAAWNARDAFRFSNVFTEDGNFQFPVEGIAMHGRDEIKKYYTNLFTTLPPNLRHVTTARETNVISPDIIAVDVDVNIYGTEFKADSLQIPIYHYLGMGLGVRTDSGWRIRLARVYQMTK